MNKERKEALLRIPIGLVACIVVIIWGILIRIIVIFQFFYVLFKGKRHTQMAKLCNHFNTYLYSAIRYITFTTNKRVFPFEDLEKEKDKVE